MAEGVVNITIKAKDKTGGAFDSAFKNISKLGKAAGLAIAGTAVLAGVAIAGVAVKGVMEFVKFEDQLNEVFTLLPDISGQAMGQMKNQVLDVSEEMGRLPNEIIPALYQSLSAGVAQDNVFDFLDIAHKAALGGVTELTTAVDGITSVVNAYGADVIDATSASDLMFTAVRLGKTTFGELSGSLSNVTPLASALGVNFGNVTAALATMTSQGTSTSQATTQMRGLLQELSTEGSITADILRDRTGQSFAELTASGVDLSGVLAIISAESRDTGVPIQDMFGNVRAGLGALQLTGKAAEGFAMNLGEMRDAAGATDAAYEVMNKGMARTFEVLQAKAATTFIKIGDALSPVVEMIGNKLFKALDKVMPIFDKVLGAFSTFIKIVSEGTEPLEAFRETFLVGMLEGLGVADETIVQITGTFDEWVAVIQNIIPQLIEFKDSVMEFVEPIIQAIADFVSWKDILIVLGGVIGVVVVGAIISLISAIGPVLLIIAAAIAIVAILRNAWENNFAGIQEKVTAVLGFLQEIIGTVIGWISAFWTQHGDAILAKARQVWDLIWSAYSWYLNLIWDIIMLILSNVKKFWAEHGDEILAKANEIWNAILEVINWVIEQIQEIIAAFTLAFEGDWTGFGEKIREVWDTVWGKIQEIITNVTKTILKAIAQFILDIIAKFHETDWNQVGTDIIKGIANGITAATGFIVDAAKRAARAAYDAALGFLGMSSPSKLFMTVGVGVSEGFAKGIMDSQNMISSAMIKTLQPAQAMVGQGIDSGTGLGMSTFQDISNQEKIFNLTVITEANADDVINNFDLMETIANE